GVGLSGLAFSAALDVLKPNPSGDSPERIIKVDWSLPNSVSGAIPSEVTSELLHLNTIGTSPFALYLSGRRPAFVNKIVRWTVVESVSEQYFKVLGTPIVIGRAFQLSDRDSVQLRPAVISLRMARLLSENPADAVGTDIQIGTE